MMKYDAIVNVLFAAWLLSLGCTHKAPPMRGMFGGGVLDE